MKLNNNDNSPRSFDDEQALSAVFRLLSHHRRRVAVQYLATQNGPTSVSDVVDQIALLEGEHTDKYKFQIWMTLVHIHLPMLAEAAVIKSDPDRETVELDTGAKSMFSNLGLVAAGWRHMDGYLTPMIEALARAEGVSPKALTPPLGVVIDVDALTQLLASGTMRVTFAYEAYSVTVTNDGDVEVTPRLE